MTRLLFRFLFLHEGEGRVVRRRAGLGAPPLRLRVHRLLFPRLRSAAVDDDVRAVFEFDQGTRERPRRLSQLDPDLRRDQDVRRHNREHGHGRSFLALRRDHRRRVSLRVPAREGDQGKELWRDPADAREGLLQVADTRHLCYFTFPWLSILNYFLN